MRIDDETDERLERLRAAVHSETGRSVSKLEIVARLVASAAASPDRVIESFRGPGLPIDEEARRRFHRGMVSSGTCTDEATIDDVLYD